MIEFRGIKENELDMWFEFCGKTFGIGADYFRGHYENDPWRDIRGIFCAFDDDVMVSSIRVFNREIYVNGNVVLNAGIGEVCTDEKYRKQGLSSRLIDIAKDYITGGNYVISTLGASVPDFYKRRGWNGIPLKTAKIVISKNMRDIDSLEGEGYHFKDINKMTEIETSYVKDMYGQVSSQFSGPIVRNDFYWENWILGATKEKFKGYVIYNGLDLAGYIITEEKDGILRVIEYVCEEDFSLVVSSLVSELKFAGDTIKIPYALVGSCEIADIETYNDYMYMVIDDRFDLEYMDLDKHLFWETDGF